MSDYPYHRISTWLHVEDGLDAEVVNFEIDLEEGLTISRDKTPACRNNPEKFPEIPAVEISFSIGSAKALRDFLNFALEGSKTK